MAAASNLFPLGRSPLFGSNSASRPGRRTTSGSLDFPMIRNQTFFLHSEPSIDSQRSIFQHILDDPDHGGVPLTPDPVQSFPEDVIALEQDGITHSPHGDNTTETDMNLDLIEGGVPLSLDSESEDSSENNEAMDFEVYPVEPVITESHPPSNFVDSVRARVQQSEHTTPIGQTLYASFIGSADTHILMASNPPSSPAETTSSTRVLGTEPTQTGYEQRPTQQFNYEYASWVDWDVAEFLERWDIQYDMGEAGLMHVNPERKRQWLPPEKQNPYERRDMQGLNWSALNTSRRKARMARKLLYPIKYPWDPMSDEQDHGGYEQQYMYAFKDFHGHHKAQYSHGQLRHLLAARGRNDIFYAAKNKVMRTSLTCPSYTDTVIDLSGASMNTSRTAGDCSITTIAVSPLTDFDGYMSDAVLVAGGYGGEYALLNLNSSMGEPATEGYVTHAHESITTHVHTLNHRRTGALGAAFCSNDRNLRLLDIDTNIWTGDFSYENEINCAVTSPDGRLRAVVGDMCETLITDAERGHILHTTKQHTEFGFACAWAPDGIHVATGGEDGKTIIYDARRWDTPLVSLSCDMSCARSLQFTTSNRGGPALVIAESDDVVSVYDGRDWCSKQRLEFFGSVVGCAALDDGQELVVANGDRTVGGLLVYERQEDFREDVSEEEGQEEEWGLSLTKQKSRKRDKVLGTRSEDRSKRFGLDLGDLVL